MNLTEFETYQNEHATPAKPTISVAEVPGADRTLVYGFGRTYDADYNEHTHTVHVYKADGLLHVHRYDRHGTRVEALSGTEVPAEVCVPAKRAYPERCDLDFARLLRGRGHALCFTRFDEGRAAMPGPFHGLMVEETTPAQA